MIASALAGCTTGDPDGDGELGIDPDLLDELIESNLQDFINNTTVTVNQEIHYHNNTTYIVDDGDYSTTNNAHFNNTTNVDGGEINNFDQSETTYNIGGASFGEGVNGSVSGGSMIFVAHLEFTGMDLFPDYELPENPQENSFSYTYTYYDYLTNSERTDTFNFACSVFYIVGSQSSNNSSQVSYWEDNDNYYNAWEQMYNSTIADMLEQAAWDNNIQQLCNDQFTAEIPLASYGDGWNYNFLTIDIPVGYALQYVQVDGFHTWYGCGSQLIYEMCTNSDNHRWYNNENMQYNFSNGPYLDETHELYGGWDNLTVDFSFDFGYAWDSGHGYYSVWPTSEYEFTLYYRFVPVIPVE